MKRQPFLHFISLVGTIWLCQSCARTSNDVWDDTKSAGRHMQRGIRSLGGKHGDSRQVRYKNDFECVDEDNCYPQGNFQDCDYQDSDYQDNNCEVDFTQQPVENDFILLQDQANDELAMADMLARQPRETPGEMGSSIPGIEYFRDPSTIPQLANLFKPIYFEYDSSLVKGQANLQTIHNIADFMRRRPNFYLFIEGHTDERGPQAYNLALGSRRGNAIRNMLMNEGVNPDNLFTISFGKERPVMLERHEEGWSKNRRAEFKVYER
jgi:peptidoglycan-associated lipoprotein